MLFYSPNDDWSNKFLKYILEIEEIAENIGCINADKIEDKDDYYKKLYNKLEVIPSIYDFSEKDYDIDDTSIDPIGSIYAFIWVVTKMTKIIDNYSKEPMTKELESKIYKYKLTKSKLEKEISSIIKKYSANKPASPTVILSSPVRRSKDIQRGGDSPYNCEIIMDDQEIDRINKSKQKEWVKQNKARLDENGKLVPIALHNKIRKTNKIDSDSVPINSFEDTILNEKNQVLKNLETQPVARTAKRRQNVLKSTHLPENFTESFLQDIEKQKESKTLLN